MDKEKKPYCRSTSEFTIGELESKIGPIAGKYEKRFFEIFKEWVNSVSPIGFINEIRDCVFLSDDTEHAEYMLAVYSLDGELCFEGMDDYKAYDIIVNGRFDDSDCEAKNLYSETHALVKRIISTVIDLGYVRRDLMLLNWQIFLLLHDICELEGPMQEELITKAGLKYETYELKWDERLEKVLEYLSDKLTPFQYDIFKFNIKLEHPRNATTYCYTKRDNEKYGIHFSMDDFLPYSEYEYELLYAAQTNAKKHAQRILEIIFS